MFLTQEDNDQMVDLLDTCVSNCSVLVLPFQHESFSHSCFFLSPSLSILLSIFISKLKWLLSPPRCSYPKNFKIYKPQSIGKTGTEFNSRGRMQVQLKSQRFSLYLKNSQRVLHTLSYTRNTRIQTHTHTPLTLIMISRDGCLLLVYTWKNTLSSLIKSFHYSTPSKVWDTESWTQYQPIFSECLTQFWTLQRRKQQRQKKWNMSSMSFGFGTRTPVKRNCWKSLQLANKYANRVNKESPHH